MRLHLDFETRSAVDLKVCGLDVYARAAEVLMLAYAFNDEEPLLWLPAEKPMPHLLRVYLKTPNIQKIAWNAQFERTIFKHCIDLDIPASQWLDPSHLARYGTFPAHLEACSAYLQLGELEKDKEGKRLIQKFCRPHRGKFHAPEDHPEDWEKFKAYCRQDVRAERAVLHKLEKVFSLPPFEQRVARIDAEINERGIPVDMLFVTEAKKLVDAEKARLKSELKELTGLANPNSGAQLLPWLRARGYPFSSLLKKRVSQALQGELSEEVRVVLSARGKLSRSSTSKLDALLDRTGPDGRLRYGFVYLGAQRTGRWSGRGVQPHNMPR